MANPLDRTWYNTLVDDDGSGTTGTIWNKAAVDSLMDAVDASLAGVVATPVLSGYLPNPSPGELIFSTNSGIRRSTADGADTGAISIGGGGAIERDRCSYLVIHGNEHPTWPGSTLLILGNLAGAAFHVMRSSDFAGILSVGSAGNIAIAGQLQFPVTQFASANPNTLDDYREQTWLPRVTSDGGASGQTYSKQEGHLTKIGRLIIAEYSVVLTNKGTLGGTVLMAGLPYVTKMAGATSVVNNVATTAPWATLQCTLGGPGWDGGYLSGFKVGAASPSFVTAADLQNNTQFSGVFVYQTTG